MMAKTKRQRPARDRDDDAADLLWLRGRGIVSVFFPGRKRAKRLRAFSQLSAEQAARRHAKAEREAGGE